MQLPLTVDNVTDLHISDRQSHVFVCLSSDRQNDETLVDVSAVFVVVLFAQCGDYIVDVLDVRQIVWPTQADREFEITLVIPVIPSSVKQ